MLCLPLDAEKSEIWKVSIISYNSVVNPRTTAFVLFFFGPMQTDNPDHIAKRQLSSDENHRSSHRFQ